MAKYNMFKGMQGLALRKEETENNDETIQN
jgi:hypothetical protein